MAEGEALGQPDTCTEHLLCFSLGPQAGFCECSGDPNQTWLLTGYVALAAQVYELRLPLLEEGAPTAPLSGALGRCTDLNLVL